MPDPFKEKELGAYNKTEVGHQRDKVADGKIWVEAEDKRLSEFWLPKGKKRS